MVLLRELLDTLRQHNIRRAYRYKIDSFQIHLAVEGAEENVEALKLVLSNSNIVVTQLDEGTTVPRSYLKLL